MSLGKAVMVGAIVGSIIGGYIPVFFGAGLLSYSSVFGNGIGGMLGIWIAYKLTAQDY